MTCAKRKVGCYIHTADGEMVAYGTNFCLFPQDTCPREPGEGYRKCITICGQVGHAEIVALEGVHPDIDLTGGKAVIEGHYRVCGECETALRANGIETIEFVEGD